MTPRCLTILLACACLAPRVADAQTAAPGKIEHPVFVDVNAGFAGKPGALETGSTFAVFGETGSAATRQEPPSSGMFDVRLGYRITPRLGLAGVLSGAQGEANGKTAASIPSPIRFASPSIVSLDAPGLKRRELGVHVQAVYFVPLSGSVMLSISGGPSMVHLQQGVPNVTVNGSAPVVTSANETGNGLGGNVGADLTTLFSPRYGAGIFVRYVAANLNLPSATSVKVGGVQAGGGFRLRF